MQITDDLKLVIPVRSDDSGVRVHAYHVPISREVFESNYRTLAATRAQLVSKGIYYQMDAGPRIAAMVLRDEGRRDASDRGEFDDQGRPKDTAASLLLEIKRLTTILAPCANGWEAVPVDAAISQGIIDAEEWQEALSSIVFFTCHYALSRKAERRSMADATASILSASITSSSLTEYAGSLQKSTTAAPTAAKAGLSVPS